MHDCARGRASRPPAASAGSSTPPLRTAPALLRSGRIDRKIEFPLPDEDGRAHIMQIHSRKMNVNSEVNFEELARCTDDFNGAQLKAVCVEAGMVALRHERTEIVHEDFMEGLTEVQSKKKASLAYYA